MQIIDQSTKDQADNNALVRQTIYPSRGLIYDRNGELLVFNQPIYEITMTMREGQWSQTYRIKVEDIEGTTYIQNADQKEPYFYNIRDIKIDEDYVKDRFQDTISREDLDRFIL